MRLTPIIVILKVIDRRYLKCFIILRSDWSSARFGQQNQNRLSDHFWISLLCGDVLFILPDAHLFMWCFYVSCFAFMFLLCLHDSLIESHFFSLLLVCWGTWAPSWIRQEFLRKITACPQKYLCFMVLLHFMWKRTAFIVLQVFNGHSFETSVLLIISVEKQHKHAAKF